MLLDFHTHTNASDGALSPTALLARAATLGVEALAVTDHDTLAGYRAALSATPKGLRLLSGVELSCVWSATTIHVVGLNFDPDAPCMAAMMTQLSSARAERAEKIDRRLAARNIPGALAGARNIAGSSQLGRPHFARWMVEQGHVGSMNAAFDKYLGQGKLGDVKTFWPSLASAVASIVEAGGLAILAHPLKYRLTRTKLHALCRDFKAAGGEALEIINGRQTGDETQRLKALASHWLLQVSVGSDFHRDWEYGPELGVNSAVAGDLPAVWETLL